MISDEEAEELDDLIAGRSYESFVDYVWRLLTAPIIGLLGVLPGLTLFQIVLMACGWVVGSLICRTFNFKAWYNSPLILVVGAYIAALIPTLQR